MMIPFQGKQTRIQTETMMVLKYATGNVHYRSLDQSSL